MEINKKLIVVASRYPYWLPELNTGIPPTIKPGDWQLSSWVGKTKKFAVRLDLDKFGPSMGNIEACIIEIKEEYDESLLHEIGWMEVIAFCQTE